LRTLMKWKTGATEDENTERKKVRPGESSEAENPDKKKRKTGATEAENTDEKGGPGESFET
jgi:hypothetical protein